MRNAAETFGLERELTGRWENLEMRGGPVRLVKGPVVVDDTVTARLREGVSPENSWTAVIRFCLDYRAIFKGKSHNRCAVSKFFIHSVYFKLGYLPC